jgi:hypothetical protein
VAVCAVLAGATTFAAIADWATDLDEPAKAEHCLLIGVRIRPPLRLPDCRGSRRSGPAT